ncbi:MAG TPA: ABC transporter ATP-binding protein [Tepidisphaeraceae bacterium]|nr:ABC transporter ATP-binding protein [Tepidisphaeraceae bacterium]
MTTAAPLAPTPAPAVAPPAAIRVLGVTKKFGSRTVLDAINLDVIRGETLVILGGSGSGKSTLLRLMIGNVRYNGGDIVVNLGGEGGKPKSLRSMTPDELDEYRKSIGVLFQSGALFNSMSVAENVALPMREHTDLPEETIEIMVKMKLEQVGLRQHAEKMPAELSGGMKKRAGLARAIALDPKVLFYDEPSAGLDPVTSAEIDQLILDLNRKLGVTSVVVTHEMDSAFRIADRMVLLDRGKFISSGTTEEMRNSADPLVRQFVYGLTEGPLTDRRRAGGYEVDLLGG